MRARGLGLSTVAVALLLAVGPAAKGQEPVLPGAPRVAEKELVERTRKLLGRDAKAHSVGGYTLLTDVDDPALIERWRSLVAVLEPAWRARYGLDPQGSPAETIALFARVRAYRELQRGEPMLAALDANGFAFGGLVALAREGMSDAELDATLQHELAHLLTRRSIGPALPSWLAEGLAEEFGQAPRTATGFDFDAVSGSVTREGNRFELRGGIASLDALLRRIDRGTLSTPRELAAVDEDDFASGAGGLGRYAEAFAWTRFLLAEPGRANAFRRFLASVARGEAPTIERLEAEIAVPWRVLLPELQIWLADLRDRTYRSAGLPLGPRLRLLEPLDELPPSRLPDPPTGAALSRLGGAGGSLYRIGGASGSLYRVGGASGSSSLHPSVPSA